MLTTAGCTHYQFPATHLESPEVTGGKEFGKPARLELLALEQGTDLNSRATLASPSEKNPNPQPQAPKSFANLAAGIYGALGEKMDIGLRIRALAPPSLRFKYQFTGEPEATTHEDNLSASFAASAGFLMGAGSTYYTADASVPVGYRLWNRHLFWIAPFFSMGGVNGMTMLATSMNGTKPVSSAGISQYGAGLGYQYTILGLFWRMELTYALGGAIEQSQMGGLYLGTLVGLTL